MPYINVGKENFKDIEIYHAVIQDRQGRDVESLSGPAARHVLDPQRQSQRGSARVLQGVSKSRTKGTENRKRE
jgi:hypothetical protein